MEVRLIDVLGDDLRVVNAARVSFGKESEWVIDYEKSYKESGVIVDPYVTISEKDQKLISYLAKHNHWTPFSHVQITMVEKLPIFVARQRFKHMVGFTYNECFSKDTEVLTSEGWKFWPSVTKDDLIATPELDGSSYSFKKPLGLIQKDYKGNLLHVHSRDLDMLVTPNHQQYVSFYESKTWTPYEKMTTVNALDKVFPKTMKMPTVDYPLGDDYHEGLLYGFFIGDGSLSKDSKRIYFHVKKERKKDFLRSLSKKIISDRWNENEQMDGYSYFRVYNDFEFEGQVHNKSINFYKKTLSFLRGVFDGLVESDGHVSVKNNTTFSTTSESLKESLIELGYLLGFDITIHTRPKIGNWNIFYKMTFKYPRPKLLKYSESIPYNDKVYCAETETGLLIVRRNGKSCVSGNCSRRYIDDPPEFYTPDSWRKRADNKKQGSSDEIVTDYVWREFSEDGKYWPYETGVDTSIQDAYSHFIDYAELFYKALLRVGTAPEQARMVLPQSMYTEVYATGSLAAWARMITLRKDAHAQKEIQDFARMCDEVIRGLPQLKYSWEALVGPKWY